MVSVNDLTLEEKAALASGADAWHLQGVESKGVPGYMITDAPPPRSAQDEAVSRCYRLV